MYKLLIVFLCIAVLAVGVCFQRGLFKSLRSKLIFLFAVEGVLLCFFAVIMLQIGAGRSISGEVSGKMQYSGQEYVLMEEDEGTEAVVLTYNYGSLSEGIYRSLSGGYTVERFGMMPTRARHFLFPVLKTNI